MIQAFPLDWPLGYERTSHRVKSQFNQTMERSQKFLRAELGRLGAKDIVVSSDIPVRGDGLLYSNWAQKRIDDPGVAVYFKYKGKEISMCCDKYLQVWENVYALGKGIEALRGMDRWGVSDFIDRAFTGFMALPEASGTDRYWYQILGVDETASEAEIKTAYRSKAKDTHPDKGGSYEAFNRIQNAYNEGLLNLKK